MRVQLPGAAIVGGVIIVALPFSGLGGTALLADETTTATQATTLKPLTEVDVGPLESPQQGRTLPFQVPFVVTGTVDRNVGSSTGEENKIVGLRVHLIAAKRPIRVEENDKTLRCYFRGAGHAQGEWRVEWLKTSTGGFSDYQPEDEPCGLVLDAGYWSAPENPLNAKGEAQGDIPFSLVLPAVEAGRHYAFGFQIRRTLPERDQEQLVAFLKQELAFEKVFQSSTLDEFYRTLCTGLEAFAEARGLVLDTRSGEVDLGICTRDIRDDPTALGDLVEGLSALETYAEQRVAVEGREEVDGTRVEGNVEDLNRHLREAGSELDSIDTLRLRWPDGKTTTEQVTALNQLEVAAEAVKASISKEIKCDCATEACRVGTKAGCEAQDEAENVASAASLAATLLSDWREKTVDDLERWVRDSVVWLGASTVYDFNTRQKTYLSADIGFVGGVGISDLNHVSEVVPYLGTNIYFQPVNKEAPLPRIRGHGNLVRNVRSLWRTRGLRCGATVGVTLDGLDDGRTRTDLFSETSLVLGGGCRITEAIRVGAGGLLYKELDPDPLIDDEELAMAPYVSLSVDWDVRQLFQGVNRIFDAFTGRAVGTD